MNIWFAKWSSGREHNSKMVSFLYNRCDPWSVPIVHSKCQLCIQHIHTPSTSTVLYQKCWFLLNSHYSKHDVVIPSTWQQLAGLLRSHGDNSLEMHDMVQQRNEVYVPKITLKPKDLNPLTSNIIGTNLVSAPNEPHVQGNGVYKFSPMIIGEYL